MTYQVEKKCGMNMNTMKMDDLYGVSFFLNFLNTPTINSDQR